MSCTCDSMIRIRKQTMNQWKQLSCNPSTSGISNLLDKHLMGDWRCWRYLKLVLGLQLQPTAGLLLLWTDPGKWRGSSISWRSDPSLLIDTRADRIALSSCFARPMVYGGPMVPGWGDMQNISQQWIVHIRAAISAASTLQFCTFIAIQILKR